MSDSNTSDAVIETEYTPPPHAERRSGPRRQVCNSAWLMLKDPQTNKLVRTPFKTINISMNGVMLDTGERTIQQGEKYHLILVLSLTETVCRIYHLDAICVHSKRGRTGFQMKVKWNGKPKLHSQTSNQT